MIDTKVCPICKREAGSKMEDHHLIPKMTGGRHGETIAIHRVCHRMIHHTFTEKQLRDSYHSVELLLNHKTIEGFTKFVYRAHRHDVEWNGDVHDTKERKAKRKYKKR